MDQNVKHVKAILAVGCLPFRQTLRRGYRRPWTMPQRTIVPGVRAISKSDYRGIENLSIRPNKNPDFQDRTRLLDRMPAFDISRYIVQRPQIPRPSAPTR